MPDAQFNVLVWLCLYLQGISGNIPIRGHSGYMETACPGQFFPMDELQRLQFRGKQSIESEVEEMDREKFSRWFAEEQAKQTRAQRDLLPSTWAAEVWKKMTAAAITDGTAPQGVLTRQEGVMLINRMIIAVGLDPKVFEGCFYTDEIE